LLSISVGDFAHATDHLCEARGVQDQRLRL